MERLKHKPEVAAAQLRYYLGGRERKDRDAQEVWQALSESWNVFHLRKDYSADKDPEIRAQWGAAIGSERIVRLPSAQRAVDLALGLISRGWGHFEDFEENMLARQSKSTVDSLRKNVESISL